MTTTQDAIIPKFDDDVETDRKLAIICSKGNLDMAYPGLILGNAALGEGVETHLFFTFWGFDMIIKSRMDDLKFTPRRQHRHPHAHEACTPACPGDDRDGHQEAEEVHRRPRRSRGPGVPRADRRLRRAPVGLPAVSADMNHLTDADLYDGVEGIISAADFIEMTDGAQLLFI